MRIVMISLLPLVLLASGADGQSMYRWVDPDGKVHYSDQPPPKEVKKVEQRRLGTNSIETSGLPFEAQRAAQDYPVIFYSSPDCKAECQGAREFLARRGIPYSETSIANLKQADEYRKIFGTGKVMLPSVTVGSQKQQGFEESLWGGLLDNAGYPRGKEAGGATK